MKINAIIIEDEPLLSQTLRRFVEEVHPDCSVLAELTNVEDSVKWINAYPEPLLIFMDIQLADGICFNIFERANVNNKAIVFTTAYDEYVMNAFEYNSLAYILKPIKKEELAKVFAKIEKIHGSIDLLRQTEILDKYKQLSQTLGYLSPRYRQRIMVTKVDGFIQLVVDNVACFIVEEKVTLAYTFTGQVHAVDSSLEKLEDELDPDIFFRANRQVIVNIEAIERIENYFNGKLVLKLSKDIPSNKVVVSRKKAAQLKQWIDR